MLEFLFIQHVNTLLGAEPGDLRKNMEANFASSNLRVTVFATTTTLLGVIKVNELEETTLVCRLNIEKGVVTICKDMTRVHTRTNGGGLKGCYKVQEFFLRLQRFCSLACWGFQEERAFFCCGWKDLLNGILHRLDTVFIGLLRVLSYVDDDAFGTRFGCAL